ncbi:MAG TPA: GMC oxidoreductase [Ktedonobacterales bacterium]
MAQYSPTGDGRRDAPYEYVIIGSGFGGSVAALRLAEKGYRTLVLERGKRYTARDFARTNWQVWKYLWAPALRCFGILQISPFRDVLALHGSGVGGGSLGYANVLMEPPDTLFGAAEWRQHADWRTLLRSHFATARRMLGVAPNPRATPADDALRAVADEMGRGPTFALTEVGVYFGDPAQKRAAPGGEAPDPYFAGAGPARNACQSCGGCMVGCRHNAKNTLDKNYLYLAERLGAQVLPETEARDIRPLGADEADGARFMVVTRRSTAWMGSMGSRTQRIRARNVVVAAGTIGTLRLLFRCRDQTGSLPRLSQRLGERVRTNGESLLGVVSGRRQVDFSTGVAITSVFRPDEVTSVEPVRYPAGSSLMRLLAWSLVPEGPAPLRIARALGSFLRHPLWYARVYAAPGWARHTTILLVMRSLETQVRMRLGRSVWTLFRRGLVSTTTTPAEAGDGSSPPSPAHAVARSFARQVDGFALGSITEGVLGSPVSAHMLGGCPFGASAEEGVVGLDFQAHGYPGLSIVDGSIMPGNPGINPSLTIAALAEYAMSLIPARAAMEPDAAPGGITSAPSNLSAH